MKLKHVPRDGTQWLRWVDSYLQLGNPDILVNTLMFIRNDYMLFNATWHALAIGIHWEIYRINRF